MSDFSFDVDAALSEVPVNIYPLIDDTDFKTRETGVVYNSAGMDLVWNFVTQAGVSTQTAVTPTTAGVYDWTHQGDGMYTIEIPASGGGSINNDTKGYGWFTGFATGILPWRGPTIKLSDVSVNNAQLGTGIGPIPYLGIAESGVAQSITATTIVLRSATVDNSVHTGMTLLVTGSTQGYMQSVLVESITGDTCTIVAWPVATPSGTVSYFVIGTPAASTGTPVPTTVSEIQVSAIADFFNTDSGTTYGSAIAGSVVKEIADNSSSSDVTAIKAKTDQLVFTKANEVDSNMQSINGAGVVGDGNATPWDGV